MQDDVHFMRQLRAADRGTNRLSPPILLRRIAQLDAYVLECGVPGRSTDVGPSPYIHDLAGGCTSQTRWSGEGLLFPCRHRCHTHLTGELAMPARSIVRFSAVDLLRCMVGESVSRPNGETCAPSVGGRRLVQA